MELSNLTIKKAREMISSKQITCKDLVLAYQKNIAEKNKDINAYLEVFDDAIKQAEEIDRKIADGESVGELAGIPIAIKDNILIKEKKSSCSSKMLEGYHATYNATVVEKLKKAGAIFLGRTNMDEFAMGSSTENSAFGTTRNPRDKERVPGGSSGGSAASVASDMCVVALGSDTGGSIRQPASLCGVVGLKPTYGAVSRYGLVAMASSLDQIGPITKTVEDAETMFEILKGQDEHDATSIAISRQPSAISSTQKLKIGVLKYDKSGVAGDVNEAIEKAVADIKNMGHEVVEIDLPNLSYSLPCYYIIQPAETSANLSRFDGVRYGLSKEGDNLLEDYIESRTEGFGKEVRRRIMLGTYVLSAGYYDAYYNKAQKVRELIKNDFKEAFESVDVILTPTSPTTAFKIGEKSDDPLQMYLSDIFTVSINLAGVPAISIPAGKDKNNLPIGLQIIAPWFREDLLFNLGKQYENGTSSAAMA